MNQLNLKCHSSTFNIHKLALDDDIPSHLLKEPMFFICKTPTELSVVVEKRVTLSSIESSNDWQALEVIGPLDFALVGIIAKISNVLAEAKISIFVLSTYDTDLILVKSSAIEATIMTLRDNGYGIKD
jgi:hypothetical protein